MATCVLDSEAGAVKLPKLVLMAIESAFSSDRQFSWKIQENKTGLLIQLVWKFNRQVHPGSIWNKPYRSKAPSRQRRDALRLLKFNEAKASSQQLSADVSEKSSDINVLLEQSSAPPQPHPDSDSVIDASKVGTSLSSAVKTSIQFVNVHSADDKCSVSVEVTANDSANDIQTCEQPSSSLSRRPGSSPVHGCGISDSKVNSVQSSVHSPTPVARRTRSHTRSHTRDFHNYPETSRCTSLHLPDDLHVTQHHVDYVRCEELDTATAVRDCMEQQWSHLFCHGRKVKVKLNDELIDGVIVQTHYIAKLSSNCLYYYATAKAEVSTSGSSTREVQFRDLSLM